MYNKLGMLSPLVRDRFLGSKCLKLVSPETQAMNEHFQNYKKRSRFHGNYQNRRTSISINSPSEAWLFVFGSVETAQKDACCVQMLDTRPEPHAYVELNRASNVQYVYSDHLLFKRPSFIHQWR